MHDRRKGSRPLLSHLIGTQELLKHAGYPPSICTAGLLHSVYGTNRFTIVCIDPKERGHVRSLAGDEAERLAWLFHTINRPRTLHDAMKSEAWDEETEGSAETRHVLKGRGDKETDIEVRACAA